MRSHVVALLGFSALACGQQVAPAHPSFSCDCARSDYTVGQPIAFDAQWAATCETKDVLAKNPRTWHSPCHAQQADVAVQCSAPCKVERAPNQPFQVTPQQPGPFSFEVELKNQKTGEVFHDRSPELTILPAKTANER